MNLLFLIVIILIVAIDQWTKCYAYSYLREKGFPTIKKNLITLRLVRNEGAALGFLENRKRLLLGLTIVLMGVVVYYFVDALRHDSTFIVRLSLAFILGGGIGNLIDRIKRKYVVDFFSFNIKISPVFNLADIFIFIGVIVLQISIIFFI